MSITDTQILSYYYKKSEPVPDYPIVISSITAAEFLLIQSAKLNRANYYPILPSYTKNGSGDLSISKCISPLLFDSKKHAALGKHRTDQLILNFNGDMPSFIEFGGIAISKIINDRYEDVYLSSISHLGKDVQKKLKDRFRFLINVNVKCLAVTATIAEVGMGVLSQFLNKFESKQNVRNTINDILILSTAIQHSQPLLTADNLLNRFAADLLNAPYTEKTSHRLLIDFTPEEVLKRRKPFESKGYINQGWQVLERRGLR